MKATKNIFLIASLLIILSFNLAFASGSESETNNISGNTTTLSGENTNNTSGESQNTSSEDSNTSSGENTNITSGEEQNTSGENTSSGESTIQKKLNSIALDSNHSIYINTSLETSMTATKSGDETYDFKIITLPVHGNVSQSSVGSAKYLYTPSGDYEGEDSFTFRLESGEYYSNIGTVNISITKPKEPVIPFFYSDMQKHWANFSASHLAAEGLIIGEKIGTKYYFCPNKTMTRGEFLMFLLATLGEDTSTQNADIKIVDEENIPDWLMPKIKKGYELRLINGISSTSDGIYFNPNAKITRAEAFVMINNALLSKTNTTNSEEKLNYKDLNSIPSWASQATQNLTAYQIIQGSVDEKINPLNQTTRGEAAELCFKLYKQINKK